MQTFSHILELRQALADLRQAGKRIALVPTMGNLHDGHLSLVKTAQAHADVVVVSIFVNPTQFGVGEDFDSYPRTLEADCAKLAGIGADMVFAPSVNEMYPSYPPHVQVLAGDIAKQLCGVSRPTHFDGVGLVVSKLFNIVQPNIAVFGKKDYQQLAIIRQLVNELNFPITIIGADIVRDHDGLALSSRNQYLSEEQRTLAPTLAKTLQQLAGELQSASFADFAQLVDKAKTTLNESGFRVDYLTLKAADLTPATPDSEQLVLLAAAWLGKTRLLDNLEFCRTR